VHLVGSLQADLPLRRATQLACNCRPCQGTARVGHCRTSATMPWFGHGDGGANVPRTYGDRSSSLLPSLTRGAAYPPEAKAGQDKGEADKDRCYVPLEWPVPTVWLIDLNLTVLGQAHLVCVLNGGRARAGGAWINPYPVTETNSSDGVARSID